MNLFEPTISIHHSEENQFSVNIISRKRIAFKDFILCNKFYRRLLVTSIFLVLLAFCIFKYIYPYPGFINGDSYSYILSAFYNLRVDTYPIGYPKFIRFFSVFSYNSTSLVAFQYFFIESSSIILLFTIYYFYQPKRWIQVILLFLIVANPAYLFLANYISSDSLFLGLSILWFANLVWILNYPSIALLACHAILILFTFMVRYNALYYPIVAAFAFFIEKREMLIKFLGLLVAAILLFVFINYTSNQFKRISKIKQFSPFSGWQIANNALYAYRFVNSVDRKQLPVRFRLLDQVVRDYFDSTRDVTLHPQEMLYASTVYMWDPSSPLSIFKEEFKKYDSTTGELTKWANVGPIYKDYGFTLIKNYPKTFIEYYIWPNFLKFYVPPVEFLSTYSTGVDTIPPIAKQWFWFNSNKLKHRTPSMEVKVLNFYPILYGSFNVIFITIGISFILLRRIKASYQLSKLLFLFSFYWIINLIFSVFASPIALRFQLFPFLLVTIFIFLILDDILKTNSKQDMDMIRRDETKQN